MRCDLRCNTHLHVNVRQCLYIVHHVWSFELVEHLHRKRHSVKAEPRWWRVVPQWGGSNKIGDSLF